MSEEKVAYRNNFLLIPALHYYLGGSSVNQNCNSGFFLWCREHFGSRLKYVYRKQLSTEEIFVYPWYCSAFTVPETHKSIYIYIYIFCYHEWLNWHIPHISYMDNGCRIFWLIAVCYARSISAYCWLCYFMIYFCCRNEKFIIMSSSQFLKFCWVVHLATPGV